MKKILSPRLNANDESVLIARWLATNGSFVKKGQSLAEVASSKVIFIIVSEEDGYLTILKKKGDRVKVGTELGYVSKDKAKVGIESTIDKVENVDFERRFSQAALEALADMGLKPEDFPGSGLITKADIEAQYGPLPLNIKQSFSQATELSAMKVAEIEALTVGQKGLINSRLTISLSGEKILMALQKRDSSLKNLTPIIIYETYNLIQEKYQRLNSYFLVNKVINAKSLEIGFAIDTGNGLKVGNLHLNEKSTPASIQERIVELSLRDLRQKLENSDLAPTSFTVTDLSQYDILDFDPLINGQQGAIMGIGADSMKTGFPVSIILTFDHRVLTGREVAEFLQELRLRVMAYETV